MDSRNGQMAYSPEYRALPRLGPGEALRQIATSAGVPNRLFVTAILLYRGVENKFGIWTCYAVDAEFAHEWAVNRAFASLSPGGERWNMKARTVLCEGGLGGWAETGDAGDGARGDDQTCSSR